MIQEIIISTLIVILLIVLVFLIMKRRKIKEQEKQKQEEKKKEITKSIGLEKNPKNYRESLIMLNKMAKEFFKEYLKNKHQETYAEIEEALKKKKEKYMVDFCEEMNYLLYSGKEIKKEDSIRMMEKFNVIIAKSKSKEE